MGAGLGEQPSVTVANEIAELEAIDVRKLDPPVAAVIDTDALDALGTGHDRDEPAGDGLVRFPYVDYVVTVWFDGAVRVEPERAVSPATARRSGHDAAHGEPCPHQHPFAGGCRTPAMVDWETALRRERAEKDRFFAKHPHSPIPPDARDDFDGLEYFPPDESYRFELALDEFEEHDTLTVDTTHDGARTYYRCGAFRFELGGERMSLTAYKSDPDDDRLWVPFRDGTNDVETYGAGRYLDLDAEDRDADGRWRLDFNRAYSPFCAYSDAYECPIVPLENWLDVRIEAGEMVG